MTAAAAYRAGIKLKDDRTDQTHDYTRKTGVDTSEVVVPKNSPAWAHDPEQLWNRVEKSETRVNAGLGRDFEIALPHELNQQQRLELAREITQNLVDRFGFAAMFSIHKPSTEEGKNHHVHILTSDRKLNADGFGAKCRELNIANGGRENIEKIREMVGNTINQHLKSAGINETVSHKSLIDQRQDAINAGDLTKAILLDRAPTVHVGKNPNYIQANTQKNDNIKQSNKQHLTSFVEMLEKNPGQQIKITQPLKKNEPASLFNSFNSKPSLATAIADASQKQQPILDTGASAIADADGNIASIEHQLGNIEAEIAILKLRPGKASDLQLRKKMALKEKLEGQLKLAHARRAEKKSQASTKAGWTPTFKTAQEYHQQKQQQAPPQQKPDEELKKQQQQNELEKAKRFRQMADKKREQARTVSGPQAAALNAEAWNLEGLAEQIELKTKTEKTKEQYSKQVGSAFRPPGF